MQPPQMGVHAGVAGNRVKSCLEWTRERVGYGDNLSCLFW